MHPSAHSSFVPDLDMNPPPSWSKPASALGLSNPLHHLPQSQQVRQLQEQIQQHRRLQQQQSHGYGLGSHGLKKKNSGGSGNSSTNAGGNNGNSGSTRGVAINNQDRAGGFQQQSFGGGGGGRQHINIKNSDDMSTDEEFEEEDQDEDEDSKSEDRNQTIHGMTGLHHHRSLSHPQLTQGFAIPAGFTGLTPSSPLSPSSPGSITSETSSMTASMLSPGLLSSTSAGYPHHGQHHQHTHGHGSNSGNNANISIHGIESSLASLASLSVMSNTSPSPSSGSSSAATAMPMSMPGATRGRPTFSTHHSSNHMATTPTTSSFQPQSLPMIYQNQSAGFIPTSSPQTPSFNAFSSALTQHFQRQQQQQQQQMSSAAMSSSLPAHTGFDQFQQQHAQHQQQNQLQSSQHLEQQQPHRRQRSRSKSLTIPAPRIIPPARVLPPRAPQTSAPRKYHGRQTRKLPTASPIAKEPVDPTRRVAHIISEQKRREKINGGFDELKSVIPECAQNTDSKATILRKAVDYIMALEDELRKYVDLYQLEAGSNPESSLEDHERER
ncbi:hypothetical protein EDD11_009734 [Mortierella claussenii]|nr:hypothetical protein EDD11_009734 [Mortierella claussenii]